jgi:hypothetical protein
MIHETLRGESLPPRKRLRAFVDAQINYLKRNAWRNGCLIDNFSAEASEHSEVIRKRSSGLRGNAPIGRILFESGRQKRRPITEERLR